MLITIAAALSSDLRGALTSKKIKSMFKEHMSKLHLSWQTGQRVLLSSALTEVKVSNTGKNVMFTTIAKTSQRLLVILL